MCLVCYAAWKKQVWSLDVTLIILFPKVEPLLQSELIALIRVNRVLSDYSCPNDSPRLETTPKIRQKPNPTLQITGRTLQATLLNICVWVRNETEYNVPHVAAEVSHTSARQVHRQTGGSSSRLPAAGSIHSAAAEGLRTAGSSTPSLRRNPAQHTHAHTDCGSHVNAYIRKRTHQTDPDFKYSTPVPTCYILFTCRTV